VNSCSRGGEIPSFASFYSMTSTKTLSGNLRPLMPAQGLDQADSPRVNGGTQA
jgi:hypothetical protein